MLSMESSRDFDNLGLGPDPFNPDNNYYQGDPGVLSTLVAPRGLAELTKLATQLREYMSNDNASGSKIIAIRTVRRELENWHTVVGAKKPADEKSEDVARWAHFRDSGLADVVLSLALDERTYDFSAAHAEVREDSLTVIETLY